jgi:hypothetical protein
MLFRRRGKACRPSSHHVRDDGSPRQIAAGKNVKQSVQNATVYNAERAVASPVDGKDDCPRCTCQFFESTGVPCRHQLELLIVLQKPLLQTMMNERWQVLPERVLQQRIEAMAARKPQRGGVSAAVAESGLTVSDRFALMMAGARAVADAASVSPALFKQGKEGLSKLLHELRGDGAAGGGAAAARGAPRKERGAQSAAIRPAARSSAQPRLERLEEEGAGEDSDGSGRNDDRCHKCSKGGVLKCCAILGCHRSYHVHCLPSDAMDPTGDEDDWKCPVCTKSKQPLSAANPKMLRGKGRPRQKRFKSADEAPKKKKKG